MNFPKPEIGMEYAMALWVDERSEYAKEQIVLNNIGLVRMVLNSLKLNIFDEDLLATGIIGIVKAINTFDTERGFKFSTYAVKAIMNEIFKTFRKKSVIPVFSLDDIYVLDDERVTYLDVTADPSHFEEKSISDIQFKESIKCLNEKERKVLLLRLTGMKQDEIANKCKISQSYVSRIIKNARKKIESKIQ